MKRGAYLVNTARGKICDRDEYLIVDGGRLAGTGAHSYSAGDATTGSEATTRSKKSA
jgi:lactate dehydrogenase-like 2-hydroxyacid dehydrogenase